MQHIVNVAFDFDDERVKKILEDTTVDTIQREIKQSVIDEIFEKQWGNKHANPERDPFREWVRQYIKDLLVEYKDDICKQAAKELVEKFSKSNSFREKVAVQMLKEKHE